MPRPGLRRPGLFAPGRLLRRRRRTAVPAQPGWPGPGSGLGGSADGGPDEGGLAGVREPRRPAPALPGVSAALPVPRPEPPQVLLLVPLPLAREEALKESLDEAPAETG